MATRSALDEAIRARKRKEEEKKAKEAKEAINRQASAPSYAQGKPKTERVKDDSINRQATPPPYAQGKKDDPRNRQSAPPSYAQPKPSTPVWRSAGPVSDPNQQRKQQGPQPAPSAGWNTPSWRSAGPPPGMTSQLADREELSAPTPRLQVGLTSPRANTGPVGLGSTAPQAPTLTTPTIQPWKPPQWDMEAERDAKLGTPFPSRVNRPDDSINRQASPPAYAMGGMLRPPVVPEREFTPSEDRVMGATQAAGQWASNAWDNATSDFMGSAAWEKAQRDMELRRKPEERSLTERASDWYNQGLAIDDQYQGVAQQEMADYQAGKQGLGETAWDLTKNLGQYAAAGAGQLMGIGGVIAPTTKPTEKLGQYAGDVVAGLQATTDYAATRPLAENTAGSWLESTAEGTWDFYKNIFLSATGQADFNPYGAGRKKYEETQKRFTEATTPTVQQAAQASQAELAKQRERALLNWADPNAVAKTFDALVDAPSQAATYEQQAQQFLQQAQTTQDPQQKQALMAQAADAGRQAYKLKNAHPIDIVNENTNVWAQMAYELLLPDITDVAGGIISAVGATPKLRRMAKVEDAIFQNEQKVTEALNRIQTVEGTKKIATAVQDTGYNKYLNLWTTGTARADIDAAEMMKVTSTLLADADTASDARLLLTQLARDPKKLVTGIAANLFQSTGLLARADADGMIRFGSMGLNTKKVQTALNSFRAVADEFLQSAEFLNKEGTVNKIDAAMSMAEAVRQGGYRAYGVATDLGNMPMGTSRVRVKTTSQGQAFLEYVGSDGKTVLKQSDPMNLIEANKQAATFNKTAKKGALAQTSMLNQVAALQRAAVSPFYIYLSPGTWTTNIVNAATTAMGDQSMIWGGMKAMTDHTTRLFGGVKPTLRSMEGVETAANVAGAAGGWLKPLKKAYSGVEEFFGERVAYKSMTDAMRRYGPKVFEQSLIPMLEAAGMDRKVAKSWANQLFEIGYQGGNMTEEFGKLLTGNAKLFNISDANPAWLEALDADSLGKLYEAIRTSPDVATAQAKLAEVFDNARNPWESIIQQAPPVPQRYAWQTAEGAKDAADFTQATKMAEKYAGVSPEASKAAREAQLAAQQAIDAKLQTLTSMVTEASDPNARYLLYNTWGQMYDETTKVRLALAEKAEEAYELTAGLPTNSPEASRIWNEVYWQPAQQLWAGRNEKANKLLETTGAALASGQPVNANFGVWDILERTARRNEDTLWATLRLEPQSGRWDVRLKQTIDAGRQLTDKAVARVYAAARRFGGPSVMDEIISAEKSVQIAGAQSKAYLMKALDKALKSQNWPEYFEIRNEVWRQLRQYETGVWKMAERNIIEEGMGLETKTGLTFDMFGEQVELVRPVQKEFKKKVRTGPQMEMADDVQQYWQVKRPDGKLDTIPDAQVPAEVKARYGKAPDVRGETELELDNVASGAALAPEAQKVSDKLQPGQTIWRQNGTDRPVTVTGITERNGQTFYTVEGSDKLIPEAEIYEVTTDRKLRRPADTDAMRQAQETVQMTAEEVAGAKQARLDMRNEWDKVAKANRGYLKLDSAVASYVRQGIAKVPENKFEDLYGVTIAGRRIEGQADVEALLQEYYNLNQSIFKKQRLSTEARLQAQEAKLATVDPQKVATDLNLGGQATTENWEEVSRKTSRATTAAGGTLPPDTSLAAQHSLDMLEQLRKYVTDNLQTIMQPGAGKVGEGQLFDMMNQFKQKVLPQWDNVKYGAAEFSDRMRSFTMVDFRNRTRMDEILGLATPYSFWFTRAVKNSAERMVFEPHIWRRVQQTEQRISQMREQAGDPQRYDGGIPIQIGDKTYYIRLSPSKYWSVFPNMIQNDYADPESANTALGFALDSAQSVGFNYYAWWDATKKAVEGNTEDIYPISYLPQGKILAETAQSMGVQLPGWAKPQFSEYNSGREALLALVGGEKIDGQPITPEEVQFVMDALRQQKTGEAPLPGQEMTPRLQQILALAEQRSAQKGLTSSLSSWLTGVNVKPYDPNERQIMEAKAAYNERGYGPENPYGSKEAKNATFDEYGFLSPAYSLGAVYNQDQTRPGASAEASLKGKEEDRIYAEMNQAAQAYIQSHPEATGQEVQAVKQPFFDQLDALKAKYPNAGYPEGQGGPPKGMNPAERAQWELSRILKASEAGKPEYPKGGTPAQMQEYYKAMGTFTPEQRATVERSLNALLAMDETEMPGISQWKGELRKLVGNQYASELIRMDEVKFASPEEQDWSDRMEVVKELNDIQRKQAEDRIRTELGQNAASLYATYSAMEKGSEAKAQFKREHPEVAAAVMLAYNQKEYAEAQKLFGKDAWKVFFDPNYPQWPGDNPTEEQKAAYNKAMDAYNKANPQSEEIRLWVNGRKRPDGASSGTVGGPVSLSGVDYHQQIAQTPTYYDFGADWTEAKRIFGDNIFQTLRNFPQTDDKKVVGQYLGAHPELYGYWEWRKELTEHPERAKDRGYTWDVPSQTLRDAVEGQPRPLGSNAQPIGQQFFGGFDQAAKPARFPMAKPVDAPAPGAAGAGPSGTPIQFANAKKVQVPGMGTELPSTTAATTGELPATKGSATTPTATGEGKTWLDYAKQNPKFVENAARQAEWNAQRKALVEQFGEESVGLYNQYLELPKDSEARKQFKREHPEVKLAIAWLYGRQTEEYNPDSKEAPKNNGADYLEAQKLFGDGIWDLFKQYDSQWSKVQKRAFYNEHPEYSDFTKWWYGDDGKGDYVKRSYVRRGGGRGGGGRSRGGGGRSYSGGNYGYGYGYGSGGNGGRQYSPEIYAKQMDSDLKVTEQDIRPWRPENISFSWMSAGRDLQPDKLKPWRKPS